MLLLPITKLAAASGNGRVDLLQALLIRNQLGGRGHAHITTIGFLPLLDIKSRIEDRLKLIVVALPQRLEFVVVTSGTLHSHAKERRADDLQRAFEDRVFVGTHFVFVAIAAVGAIGAITQKMRGGQQFNHFGRDFVARFELHQFIAGQLLANELIERLVGGNRANYIVAIPPGQRAIGVGTEVAIRVGIAGRINQCFPPLAVLWRCSI